MSIVKLDSIMTILFQRMYQCCWITCLAILPISHTTALRNLLILTLLILLTISILYKINESHLILITLKSVPAFFWLWVFFLILFPIWSTNTDEALLNMLGQWGQSILIWVIGFSTYRILGQYSPSLITLAAASCFPILLHIITVIMAWGGVFGFPYPTNLNFVSGWEFFSKFFLNFDLSLLEFYPFPLSFRGVEPMHGNIGYAACQTIALLCSSFLFAWINKFTKNYILAFLGIVICLASMLIASSRGSFIFAILIILLAICIFFLKINSQEFNVNKFRANKKLMVILAIFLTLASGVLFLTHHVIKNDIRWQTMLDKIGIGWSLTDPTFILCEGLAESDKESIRQNFKNHAPDYVEELISGVESQDGARILLMRAGIELVIENPFGVDGARSTYMKLIRTKCGHEPRLTFAHLHQSWMDLALALGWVGVVIFAWLLLSCLLMGWRGLNSDAAAPWAFALILVSAFWFIRGFADSLYREHYLQMQAFIMAYLYTRVAAAMRD